MSALEHNLELRGFYDQIPRVSTQPEINPALFDLLNALITQPHQGEIRLGNIYTEESLQAQEAEILRRGGSGIYLRLAPRHHSLLTEHSFLTEPAIRVADLQFAQDFAYGRRVEDRIYSATQVRFPSSILLDIRKPKSPGVFDEKLTREIERDMYGAYLDWGEILAYARGGMEVELDLLDIWKQSFKDRYGSTPFPNLDR